MSGICGIVRWDAAPVSAAALGAPMAEMAHYGSDGSGLWREGPIALGHLMTHVTPESLGEHLPFHDAETGLTITCDARLDNRDELFATLGVPHTQRAAMPDSVLILRAYAKWGEETPIHLLGNFAFAIWDSRHRHLFCARDIMGMMPFYYHTTTERFVFAGDMKAMLAFSGVEPVLDMITLAGYFNRNKSVHLKRSFYRDVPKLPPAHALTAGPKGVRTWAYWDPEQAPNVRLGSEAAYTEALVALLQDSVACRVRSSFPVAAHVSGGLDSSGVAVLAARALRAEGRELAAGYSWSPPLRDGETYLPSDERPVVEAVCAQGGFPAHYVDMTPTDWVAPLLRDISTQPTETLRRDLVISRMAAESGIRVLLSGWGGDEAISHNGRTFYTEMLRCGRWGTLAREIRARGAWSFLKGRVLLPLLPASVVHALRPDLGRRPRAVREPLFYHYLQPGFAEKLREASAQATHRWPRWTRVHATQLYLLRHGHLTWRIESHAALGATPGVVYRYPLLDRRIIEFAFGLPPEIYVHNGWPRYLFRRAMEGVLPANVQWRRGKRDTALFDEADQASPTVFPLLRKALLNRRTSYPGVSYVDLDRMIEALTAMPGGSSQGVMRAAAVAFLNPAARLP